MKSKGLYFFNSWEFIYRKLKLLYCGELTILIYKEWPQKGNFSVISDFFESLVIKPTSTFWNLILSDRIWQTI